MGVILDKTIDRAISKGWIPTQDKEPVKAKIGELAAKYGFSVDDFAKATHLESYGMNPTAGCTTGGCFGIIQFCTGTGLNTIGETRASICSKSILQQLTSVDKFFNAFPQTKNAGSLDLADLYIAILYPAMVGEKDFNKRIPAGNQADIIEGPGGVITKSTIVAGINKLVAQNLGGSFTSEGAIAKTGGGSVPGDYAPGTGTAVQGAVTGLISAVFNKVCTEQFPINFTLKEAITYVGCKTKLASAQMGGGGLAYPPQAMQVQGASATGLAGYAAGTPVCPGCFIWPTDTRFTVGSPYGPRNGRMHAGIDINSAGINNTPVYTVGDGKIVTSGFHGDYGNQIVIAHPNGLFTRYGHMIAPGLPSGTEVKQGTPIGRVGSTGRSSGPHLHFEVLRSNNFGSKHALNPMLYLKKT